MFTLDTTIERTDSVLECRSRIMSNPVKIYGMMLVNSSLIELGKMSQHLIHFRNTLAHSPPRPMMIVFRSRFELEVVLVVYECIDMLLTHAPLDGQG